MPRGRKRAVSQEKMKDWLRLVEVDGKSAPEIGKMESDQYDSRTVRKYIELARQERETNDARAHVLRNAIEHHYEDLVAFAQKLDQAVALSRAPVAEKSDRMWSALRQHLPRSPIPKMIDRWERLHQDISSSNAKVLERLKDIVASSQLQFRATDKGLGIDYESLTSAVTHRLGVLSSRETAELPVVRVWVEKAGESIVRVVVSGWPCAVVPPERQEEAADLLNSVFAKVNDWPELEGMRKSHKELASLTEALREELATIVLRRVLPGRCKYCPI
jgi:hypothetical protein